MNAGRLVLDVARPPFQIPPPMTRALCLLALSSTIAACGGSPAPAPAEPPAPAATTAPVAPPAAQAAPEAPAAKAAPADPSEAKLRAAKSLEAPFPAIADVTQEIGAPAAQGKLARRQWWFDAHAGKSPYCSTVDVIRLPSGRVAFDTSIMNSPDCPKAKAKKTQVEAVVGALAAGAESDGSELGLDRLATRSFDEVAGAFESKLGAPQQAGEPDLAAWRYVADDGTCRLLVVVHRLGSNAEQTLWGLPCE